MCVCACARGRVRECTGRVAGERVPSARRESSAVQLGGRPDSRLAVAVAVACRLTLHPRPATHAMFTRRAVQAVRSYATQASTSVASLSLSLSLARALSPGHLALEPDPLRILPQAPPIQIQGTNISAPSTRRAFSLPPTRAHTRRVHPGHRYDPPASARNQEFPSADHLLPCRPRGQVCRRPLHRCCQGKVRTPPPRLPLSCTPHCRDSD